MAIDAEQDLTAMSAAAATVALADAPVAPSHRAARRDGFVTSALAAGTTLLALQIIWGYRFGFADQSVLLPKGIVRAEPTAFRGDWFAHQVSQPHWVFEQIVAAGERAGLLHEAMFAYYLISIAAFGYGAMLAARTFSLRPRPVAAMLGPLLALGPVSAAGSTTPLLAWALPHVLGGCLAFACLGAMLQRRWTLTSWLLVATALAHIQHGTNVAIVVAAGALVCAAPRVGRTMGALCAAVVISTLAIARWRGVLGSTHDTVRLCRDYIPYHCDASRWRAEIFWRGLILLVGAIGLTVAHRRGHGDRTRGVHLVEIVVGLPAVGLVAGVSASALQIPVLSDLAATTNVFRLVTLVFPFGVLGLLVGATSSDSRWRLAALMGIIAWLVLAHGPQWRLPIAIALCAAVFVAMHHRSLRTIASGAAAISATLLLAGAPAIARHPTIGWDRSDPQTAMGLSIGDALDDADAPGAPTVLAAAQNLDDLRLTTHHAVIADGKSLPFGGADLIEYDRRIAALGGFALYLDGRDGMERFHDLTVADLERLRRDFGATHALIDSDDPKFELLTGTWPSVWTCHQCLWGLDWAVLSITLDTTDDSRITGPPLSTLA